VALRVRAGSPPPGGRNLGEDEHLAYGRGVRIVLLALAGLGLAAVLAAGLVLALQRRLLYFPSHTPEPVAVAAASRMGLAAWRDSSGNLLGWRTRPAVEAPIAALVLHGNAGTALDRAYYVDALARPGLEVALLEYPGYGPRPGLPALPSLTAAALEGARMLAAEGKTVWLVGESLGSGVAARCAAEQPDLVRGLLLITPFADLASVARHHFPFLPGFLLRDRYRPARDLAGYRGRVVVLVAGRDEVVTPAEGRRLFDALAGPKKLVEQPEATHNGLDRSPRLPFWNEALEFLSLGAGQR
jgi:uncharacterized protein